jgi:glucosamine--fructose-6-phosphate aminotransferase (isomerizing)
LHVRFHDHLSLAVARGALQGYRNRWSALRDAVLETEPTFREDLLAELAAVDLLVEPIRELADRWRSG